MSAKSLVKMVENGKDLIETIEKEMGSKEDTSIKMTPVRKDTVKNTLVETLSMEIPLMEKYLT